MKKLFSIAVLSVLVLGVAFGTSGQKGMPFSAGNSTSVLVTTFANSQIDTLIVTREAGVATYGFSAQWSDSVQLYVTGGIALKRVVNNTIASYPSAVDTLTNSGSFVSTTDGDPTSIAFANGASYCGAITITPLWDKLLIIVKYAASGNGVTTPTVRYEVHKVYSK